MRGQQGRSRHPCGPGGCRKLLLLAMSSFAVLVPRDWLPPLALPSPFALQSDGVHGQRRSSLFRDPSAWPRVCRRGSRGPGVCGESPARQVPPAGPEQQDRIGLTGAAGAGGSPGAAGAGGTAAAPQEPPAQPERTGATGAVGATGASAVHRVCKASRVAGASGQRRAAGRDRALTGSHGAHRTRPDPQGTAGASGARGRPVQPAQLERRARPARTDCPSTPTSTTTPRRPWRSKPISPSTRMAL